MRFGRHAAGRTAGGRTVVAHSVRVTVPLPDSVRIAAAIDSIEAGSAGDAAQRRQGR
jgi:hypothetical protein